MGLTVKQLHDKLEPLLEEYGDLEVTVLYDDGFAGTTIADTEPAIRMEPMKEYSRVVLNDI